ncbi:hypothetical protein QBC39DRAFT_342333 [Podospora conica]|nr:hypothetical protein QBC39DRAFT_342333 [Schizothecium conicum]
MGDDRWDFRRLRRALRRNGSPSKAKDGAGDQELDPQGQEDFSTAPSTAVANANANATPGDAASTITSTITHTQMQHTADDQNTSTLFSRLPLEIRRLIYLEVWRDYIQSADQSGHPELRLHLYTYFGVKHRAWRHLRCLVHKGAPPEEDTHLGPSPFDNSHTHPLPPWYFFAWNQRKYWGKHWKCQSANMKRWDRTTGITAPDVASPFLPVFLTCKKMYWEAIASLFNHTTLVFTSSEDAYRFFVHDQHPLAYAIRSIELIFTDPNDHLFLVQIQRETPANAADAPNEAEPEPGTTITHMFSRIEVFGPKLWTELIRGLRAATPGLRDLDVVIGGGFQRDLVLDAFGGSGPDRGLQGDELTGEEEGSGWAIPGKVEVMFTTDGLRYVQDGSKMIVQR